MFVVLIGSVLHDGRLVRDVVAGTAGLGLHAPDSRSGSGSPCSSPTSPRRWPKAAARRRRTRSRVAHADAGQARSRDPATDRDAFEMVTARPSCARGDLVVCHARRHHPRRRRGGRGRGVGRRDRRSPASRAPVMRESGGDRSAVTGGTKVLSDYIVVRITANPGETFLDRMIALVEGASRQKTPNEIALTILLSGLTIVFLFAVATLQPFAIYSGGAGGDPDPHRAARLPHPDDDRRTALGDRHRRHGPDDPAERDRDERPRGRGRGRRQHAAARQDRHDHARQPAGGGVHSGGGRARRASSPTARSSPRCPTRRPKGAASSCSRRRGSGCAVATSAASTTARPT